MEQKTKSKKLINHGATEPLSCPPLETLPNKNNPVDCFCERKPEFLISRRGRKRVAFTLAEVLITLAIIGVVAAITIPSLVKNYNEKAWGTAQDVFTKRTKSIHRTLRSSNPPNEHRRKIGRLFFNHGLCKRIEEIHKNNKSMRQ